MSGKYERKAKEIITDPSTPDWVVGSILRLNEVDVCDALNGLEVLKQLYELRLKEALEPNQA